MTENLGAVIDHVVAGAPERAALVIDGETVTYGQLGEATASVANALTGMGVGPGDTVMLVDECSTLFLATALGAARIGAAAAPMSHRLAPGELRELHAMAGCDRAVAGQSFVGLVGEALGRSPLPPSITLTWGGDTPEPADVADEDTAVVLFTSGTTGLPKPVPLSHADLVPRVKLFSSTFDPQTDPTRALVCVPVVHVGGLVGLLVALSAGTTSVVMPRFDAGHWLGLVEEHRIQRTFMVPTMLQRILDHPGFAAADLSSLEAIAYGAAPARPELVRRAVEAFPHVSFSNVYGQTETLGAVTMLGPDDHRDPARIGSVGRPLPGLEWRIVEPGTEREMDVGEPGEFQVLQHGQWHATGDVLRTDDDGYLWTEDRLSDTINRGGEKLGPIEVETVLRRHPAVADAAVAGLPDEEMGERVGAAVVLAADAAAHSDDDTAAEQLLAFCKEELAPWKVPEVLVVVDEIPTTELGKISRPEIARLIEGADRESAG